MIIPHIVKPGSPLSNMLVEFVPPLKTCCREAVVDVDLAAKSATVTCPVHGVASREGE